jgi:hypothetical protein
LPRIKICKKEMETPQDVAKTPVVVLFARMVLPRGRSKILLGAPQLLLLVMDAKFTIEAWPGLGEQRTDAIGGAGRGMPMESGKIAHHDLWLRKNLPVDPLQDKKPVRIPDQVGIVDIAPPESLNPAILRLQHKAFQHV